MSTALSTLLKTRQPVSLSRGTDSRMVRPSGFQSQTISPPSWPFTVARARRLLLDGRPPAFRPCQNKLLLVFETFDVDAAAGCGKGSVFGGVSREFM